MGHLEANIKKARDTGGSAGMLDNGRWELHFSQYGNDSVLGRRLRRRRAKAAVK